MIQINKQFDMPALNKMAQDFAMETDRMDAMESMTDDIIGDMLEGDMDANEDEDAAADEILASVMDAEGIARADQFGQIPQAPGMGVGPEAAGPQRVAMGADGPPAPPGGGGGGEPGGGDSSLAELEARMDALRRGD